jgi:PAS domain S-box-containing protein
MRPEYLPTFRWYLIGLVLISGIYMVVFNYDTTVTLVIIVWFLWLLAPLRLMPLTIAATIALTLAAMLALDVTPLIPLLLLLAASIGLGGHHLLLSLEWRLAGQAIMEALARHESADQPDQTLDLALRLLCHYTNAAQAVVLAGWDEDDDARVYTSFPQDDLTGKMISRAALEAATRGGAIRYYERVGDFPAPVDDLLAEPISVGALAALPFRHDDTGLTGAMLLFWKQPGPVSRYVHKLIETLYYHLVMMMHFQQVIIRHENTSARLQAILTTIPQGVIFIDDSGQDGWINERAAQILELESGPVATMSIIERISALSDRVENPDAIARQMGEFFDVLDGEIRDWVWVLAGPERRVIKIASTPLRSRGIQGSLWLLDDITQAYSNHVNLEASEERYRLVAENSTDMITTHTPDGFYLYISPAGKAILGYQPEEMIGRTPYEFIHPDDIDEVLAIHQDTLQQPQPHTLSARVRRSNGEYIWLETVASAVTDADGKVTMIVAISRDITARREREAQQMQLELEREKARVLAHFIQSASHEFGTPLSIINTSLHMLERVSDDESRQRHIDKLGHQLKYVQKLVSDLIIMARLDGMDAIEGQRLDVCDLLEDAYKHYQQQAVARDIDFILRPAYGEIPVSMDPEWLHRALGNLIENALQYTPPGGRITISSYTQEQQVVIEVTDSGAGIDPENLDLIFDRFHRIDKARTTPGSGLGLSIVRKIVEMHDGQIDVRSRPGKGSVFRIWLPRAEGEPRTL